VLTLGPSVKNTAALASPASSEVAKQPHATRAGSRSGTPRPSPLAHLSAHMESHAQDIHRFGADREMASGALNDEVIQQHTSAHLNQDQDDLPLQQRSGLTGSSSRLRNKPTKKMNRLPPVVLSSATFTGFWTMLVVLHTAHAAFLIACACLYYYIEHPYLSYYADLLAPPEDRHSKLFGTILGFLGGWSAIECLSLVFASIRSRKPAIPSVITIKSPIPQPSTSRQRKRHRYGAQEST